MNRIFILTPLIVLLIICIFSLVYLLSGKDPNKPPSALLHKDVPIFESSSLYNAKDIIKTKDIKNKKTLINFFASWCSPCKIEHPLFFEIRKKYPELYLLGFNHKDPTSDAKKYLKDDGNPYDFVGVDSDGNINFTSSGWSDYYQNNIITYWYNNNYLYEQITEKYEKI